jgi:hypothetical protein
MDMTILRPERRTTSSVKSRPDPSQAKPAKLH